MDKFPPLDCWFDITSVTINPDIVRYDLVLKSGISPAEYQALIDELCMVIARLRLTCPPKTDPDDKLENGLEAGYTLGKASEICRISHLPSNKSSAN